MIRTFDVSTTAEGRLAVAVLAELQARCQQADVSMLVIGAAARDLTVHLPAGELAVRATRDVDVAVAVGGPGTSGPQIVGVA